MSSTRRKVSSLLSLVTWVLILSSWIPGFPQEIFGIRTFFIALFLIFTRGIILNLIFGPVKRRPRGTPIIQNQPSDSQYSHSNSQDQTSNSQYQTPVNAKYCQSCGTIDDLSSNFCQECGIAFANEEPTQSYK